MGWTTVWGRRPHLIQYFEVHTVNDKEQKNTTVKSESELNGIRHVSMI